MPSSRAKKTNDERIRALRVAYLADGSELVEPGIQPIRMFRFGHFSGGEMGERSCEGCVSVGVGKVGLVMGRTCEICGHNTPYTDWLRCEDCYRESWNVPGDRPNVRLLSTPESRKFWENVEKSAARVRDLPAWTGAGINLSEAYEGVEREKACEQFLVEELPFGRPPR